MLKKYNRFTDIYKLFSNEIKKIFLVNNTFKFGNFHANIYAKHTIIRKHVKAKDDNFTK